MSALLADHGLTPGRYAGAADVADDGEPIADKITRLQKELFAEFDHGQMLEQSVRQQLRGLSG